MNAIHWAVLTLFLFLSLCLTAQDEVDIIVLKNGSIFKGKVQEHQPDGTVRLQLRAGGAIEFQADEVSRIEHEQELPKMEKGQAFRAKGVFNALYFSTLSGSSDGSFRLGVGLHNVTGYHFHRMFGLGMGFGVDTYSFDDGETIYPVFAEARGYLSQKRVAPYYSGSAGYGLAFKNSDELIRKAEGGLFFRAAMGLRLGAEENANVLADIGYQYQKAYFERRTPFQNEIEKKRLEFNRIVLRIGLIF